MKIEKEKKKKAYQVNFEPVGGLPDFEIIFAESKGQAKGIAYQTKAGRKLVRVEEVKDGSTVN